ncbi:MAG TPA: hypothetical protein VGO53_00310 [Steroidobacteraceae bacterium]|nr:hypothetical protein [Steroidobacteraceae bacterium]
MNQTSPATQQTWLTRCMTRGHDVWIRLSTCGEVLKIVRFSLLVPAALIAAMVFSDQMRDILRAIGEDALSGQIASLLIATAFTALVIWYAARTMLRFNFAGNPASSAEVMPRLKRHLPRLLAVSIPAAVAIRVATLAHGSAEPLSVYLLAAALTVIAILVGLYVYQRRNLARMHPALQALADQEGAEQRNLATYAQLPAGTQRVIKVLLFVDAAFMILYIVRPVAGIGAPAILLLALGLIAITGSVFVYMANHYEVPILTVLVVWLIVMSPFNDNHSVRATADMRSHGFLTRASGPPVSKLAPSPLADREMDQYFTEWWKELAALDNGAGPVPVVLVAAEGGGLRAAYWSASVLAQLEDITAKQRAPFSRHVFAISGVSGGALGGATFAAIVARRAEHPEATGTRVDEADHVLGRDFLSPALASMLFPDFLQRFIPLPLFNDRAIAIEESWEEAWDAEHPEDAGRLRRPFHDLWSQNPHAVPLLFLNSTVVETGQRAIVHPLGSYPEERAGALSDTLDVSRILGTELPLSTAAHLSARFTYVSPAGLVDTRRKAGARRWVRLVDGGYFDNSGTATLEEIARRIQRVHARMPNPRRPMRIIVLHIPNSPPNVPPAREGLGGRVLLSESLSPIRALLAARGAHATQAVEFMRSGADKGSSEVGALSPDGTEKDHSVEFITLNLYRDRADLPLGWDLSSQVRRQIQGQLTRCVVAANPKMSCANEGIDAVARELGASLN